MKVLNVGEDFFAVLEEILPPFITREEIPELLGKIIASKTLANRDSLGTGPEERIKIGKKVAYPKPAFLKWFRKEIKIIAGVKSHE